MTNVEQMQKSITIDRKKMVVCMEYIARQLNDEDLLMNWLALGVADSDISYGDLSLDNPNLDCYINSDTFAELMDEFLKLMHIAFVDDSGLFCGNVVSERFYMFSEEGEQI